jgi:hypothetical protein
MITEIQIDKYGSSLCEGVVLAFHLWAKKNGWTYLEGRRLWINGYVELPHETVYKFFLNDCNTVTDVTQQTNETRAGIGRYNQEESLSI